MYPEFVQFPLKSYCWLCLADVNFNLLKHPFGHSWIYLLYLNSGEDFSLGSVLHNAKTSCLLLKTPHLCPEVLLRFSLTEAMFVWKWTQINLNVWRFEGSCVIQWVVSLLPLVGQFLNSLTKKEKVCFAHFVCFMPDKKEMFAVITFPY